MLNIPDGDSFTPLVAQIKGAKVDLTMGGSKKISETIVEIESIQDFIKKISFDKIIRYT